MLNLLLNTDPSAETLFHILVFSEVNKVSRVPISLPDHLLNGINGTRVWEGDSHDSTRHLGYYQLSLVYLVAIIHAAAGNH